jgi:hypothetical protein
MRSTNREYMDDATDLRAFAEKVTRLRAEGLCTQDVARRLGVPPATLYGRLRKLKETHANTVRPGRS